MEQLRVQWTEFPASLAGALGQLQHAGELADVTLACEGRRIHAHKLVLSACSPYFRDAFKENPCHHPIIILKDVQAQDIVNLLSYMYQGEVNVEESKLSSFIQTAELLQVKGLSANVMTQIKRPTPTSNQKKSSSRLSISKKIFPSASAKDDVPAPTADNPLPQAKRRRNSASERLMVVPTESSKKTKKEKSNLSKKLDSNLDTSKNNERHDSCAEKSETGTSRTFLPPEIEIKHEIEEPPDQEDSEDNNYSADDYKTPSPPLYESSMLARSLLSGVHALKNDQGVAAAALSKSLLSSQLTVTAIPASQPPNAARFTSSPEDGFVKTEKLSPRSDVMELEPEVLISEQEESLGGRGVLSKNHVQTSSRSDQAGTSNSQASFNQTNHAAICGDCPHCGTKYSNQSALKYHVRLMHSDLTNRLCCYLCPRSFTMRDTFKEHMWSSHGQRN